MPRRSRFARHLDERGYRDALHAFRSRATERDSMLAWVRERLTTLTPQRERVSVLSIGAGDGDFDIDFLQLLKAHIPLLDYTAVEPNHIFCETFRKRVEQLALPGLRVESHGVSFEQFQPHSAFHLIHFTHCLYYVADREAAIRKALRNLTPDGQLLILHQTPLGIHQVQERYLRRVTGSEREMVSSDDIELLLQQCGLDYAKEVIESSVEVTECFLPESREGALLLGFFLECDSSQIPSGEMREILAYLRQISRHDGERSWLPQPVAAFSLRR